jgi:exportin-T
MEICVRYCSFFEKHTQYINPVLQNFLRLVHHPSIKVKIRSWYLFQRYVRYLRSHIGNVAETVIEHLTDLLPIKAEIPDEEETDEASSEDHDSTADAVFNSQLYLFEAIGCICGSASVPTERQVLYTQNVMSPIFSDMEQHLQAAKGGDDRAVLQVHHDLMALGTLARGFSDWTPGSGSATPGLAPSPEVQAAFARVSEATLVALKSLRNSFSIRTAARFAFSRLIGVLGAHILPQLPDWIEGLLTQTSTKDEMALFLRLLEQVIYGFKNEISSILDSLFTHLLQRVFTGLAEPSTGTDDEIQLAELKREYINFLIIILNNDLGSVIVSAANQPIFETVISTIEHFAKDAEDSHTARMAFQLLTKMCSIWGGPDIAGPAAPTSAAPSLQPSFSLPGFDRFMMTRFSPLCWAVPMNRAFNPKDAQARQVLAEAALLQKTIYIKTGQEYLSWLRDDELTKTGMPAEMITEYLRNLVELDQRAFKAFFQHFIAKGGGA